MKLLINILILVFSLSSFGVTFESKSGFNTLGVFEKTLVVNCDSQNSSFCEKICTNPTTCRIIEPDCIGCATIKNHSLYLTYIEGENILRADDQKRINADILAYFLSSEPFVTLTSDSFLNILNPEKKIEIKRSFQELCVGQNSNAILLATLNHESQSMDKLVGVICQDAKGAYVKPIQYNSKYSNEQNTYWSDLQQKKSLEQTNLDGSWLH